MALPFNLRVRYKRNEEQLNAEKEQAGEMSRLNRLKSERLQEFYRTKGIGMKIDPDDDLRKTLVRGRGRNIAVSLPDWLPQLS